MKRNNHLPSSFTAVKSNNYQFINLTQLTYKMTMRVNNILKRNDVISKSKENL